MTWTKDDNDKNEAGGADEIIAEVLARKKIAAYVERAVSGTDLMAMDDDAAEFLIDGVVEDDTTTLLIGPPGSFKSLLAQSWSWCVGAFTPWLGHQAWEGGALYVYGEGPRSLSPRMRAWAAQNNGGYWPEAATWTGMAMPGLLGRKDAWQALHQVVKERLDGSLRLVCFDTLSSLWGGAGEANDTAADTIAAVTEFRMRYGAAAVVVHHVGWTNRMRARGSSTLEANADTVLAMVKTSKNTAQLHATKRRDGSSGVVCDLRLAPMDGTGSVVLELGDEVASWQSRIRVALTLAAGEAVETADLMVAVGVERGGAGYSGFRKALTALRSAGEVVGERGVQQLKAVL